MKVAAWAAIVALTAVVYWPAMAAGFVGDDFMILHRLRAVDGVADALRFFRGEFFEYYRPLGFVSHAVDWLIAGQDARRFHLTNLILHVANTSLVFLIASAPAVAGEAPRRRLVAGTAASLLFGLHASNHEAVVWISARFDLLATFFSLASLLWVVRSGGPAWIAAVLFFPALLSKESAVAMPIAAAAWAVFRRRTTSPNALRQVLPWLSALAVYAILRSVAGGVPAAGGGGRLPKLVAFAAVLAGVIALGGSRFETVRAWLREHRRTVLAVTGAAIAAASVAAGWLPGVAGALAREKLSVAGFGIFYLLSPIVDVATPPYFLDPATKVYWLGGAAALVFAVAIVALLWRPLVEEDVAWFAAAFLIATLIPISALTEGKRYLYLPSAALAVLIAALVRNLRPRARAIAGVAVLAVTVVSAWQVTRKVSDWVWAGRMVADGARLVDDSLAPACGGHVVFLTSPVAVRGVYTHFLYETFELPRGCKPDVFQVLARVVRLDTKVEVRWDGPSRIAIDVRDYEGNLVLSRDLRQFDIPLRATREANVPTPLGLVTTSGTGPRQRVDLAMPPGVQRAGLHVFYYSEGRIRRLPSVDRPGTDSYNGRSAVRP